MQNWRRPWVIGGYIGYALALFALFTYLNFPSQQVRAFVLAALSRLGLHQVRIGAVQPLLPAGMTLREVSVAHEVNGQRLELVHLPALQIWLRRLPPFANPLRIGFEGGLYGGNILGAVEWQENGQEPALGIRVDLRDIRPAVHPLVARLGNPPFEGKLTGNMTLQLSSSHWRDGNGRLMIQGDTGNIAGFEIKGVRLPPLTYEQLAGELVLQQRSLMVKEFSMRGRDWQLEAHGNVSLHQDMLQSPLNLTVRVRASEGLEQQLGMVGMFLKQRRDRRGFSSFKIGGTLEHPQATS
jgi:type II secretion system protein N